ncbi:hypothetical protein L915_06746 [Phytophthora nicotianae]|uniref:Uncharacterized protein n=1 Tax=Phytophthora nicotianae TaxID=4792 RepID=W2H3F5_PHYNI|nr:hypothetical protein L915_06746 [Phytophthora nicotianae]
MKDSLATQPDLKIGSSQLISSSVDGSISVNIEARLESELLQHGLGTCFPIQGIWPLLQEVKILKFALLADEMVKKNLALALQDVLADVGLSLKFQFWGMVG